MPGPLKGGRNLIGFECSTTIQLGRAGNTHPQYLGGNAGPTDESRGASTDAESVGEVAVSGAGGGEGCCSIESIVDMSLDTLFSSWLSCLHELEIFDFWNIYNCNSKYRAQLKVRSKVG